MNTPDSLKPFFDPKGVAVVGASDNPTKLGYRLANNLVRSHYQGAVHFVNIKGGELLGRPIYTSLKDVPDPVDLATILIPAPFVADVLRECGQRGIHAVIVGSGGFREAGPEGKKLEDEIIAVAEEEGIRMIGPNCIGLLDTHLPIDATFLPPPGPTPGDVAFISQSGAICAAVIDWARGQGYGLSRLLSMGNQADLSETDMLATVASDPYTNVLALYIEGIKDGCRFVEEARKIAIQKPIIALKVGRFEAGQRAVASHTGALAGKESAYNAAFRRAGVLRAETSEEMFDRARALAWCPLPKGRRVAVLTNAGGPGVTAADALEGLGLELADFSEETQAALRDSLPAAAGLHNPVDMLAGAAPEDFARNLEIMLADPGVDSAMVIFPTPPMSSAGAVAKAIIPTIHSTDKPVVVAVMGELLIQEAVEHFRAARVPEYRFPERAAAALAALIERSELLDYAQDEPILRQDVTPSVVDENLDNLRPNSANNILEAYGISTARMTLAHDPDEAAAVAEKMGYPVVIKVSSADISHKSDVGGVLLDLGDEEAVKSGFNAVVNRAQSAYPNAKVDGVCVQRMIPSGQEVIVGAVQDPQFGPVVMFGSGGTEVEGLKDVAFGLAPLTPSEAELMLESTWAGRKLKGYRNLPPADRDAVLEALIRMAQLAAEHPRLEEIEINPLQVLPEGQGAIAVDVRITVGR